MNQFQPIAEGILALIEEWEPKLLDLPEGTISGKRNGQGRTIRQIVGHMCDSASNNLHRTVYLQYRESPFDLPNYAIHGANDKWIAIQDFQNEDWHDLVQLWKYSNVHIAHVFGNVDPSKKNNQWKYSEDRLISLEEGIVDYLRHFKLHISEIVELINA